jgi:microcystin degradation protein MlrC
MMKNIALIGLKQETNTFNRLPTTIEVFRCQELVVGRELQKLIGKEIEISGFYEVLNKAGMNPVPVIFAEASPGGPVAREFFHYFTDVMVRSLDAKIDAILLALHGAMVVSGVEDAQGDLVELLRKRYGPAIPIVATFDFHANMSERMVRLLNGVVAYETHPHVDQESTGRRGAELLLRQLEERERYSITLARVPALLSPHNIRTEANTPMAAMIRLARDAERSHPEVRSVSIFAGFPNADTPDTAASVVVTARDVSVANAVAGKLARELWEKRLEFNPRLPSMEEAIQEARRLKGNGLVVVCEFADGIGQGGATDGTAVLDLLIRCGMENVAHGPLADPEAVRAAIEAGVGNQVEVLVGGKIDTDNFRPLRIRGTVRVISDGRYVNKSPVWRGMPVNMGRTAVIRTESIDLVVTENRVAGYDPTLFRSVGIEPTDKDAIFIKQGTLAQASYLPIAHKFILMSSPGWGTTEYSALPYKRVRRPIYPLDEDVRFP